MQKLLSLVTIALAASAASAQSYSITNCNARTMWSQGWFQYGDLYSMLVSDNWSMIASSPTTGTPISLIWSASTIMDDFVNMKQLSVMVEGRHGYAAAPIELRLRDQTNGGWVVLAQDNWTTTDKLATYTMPINPARFVSPGGVVDLMFKGAYPSQNVQCVDVIRFIHEFDTFGPKKRFHDYPSLVKVNRGTWVQGMLSDLARSDEGSVVALDAVGGSLDWECEFAGLSYSGTFKDMELTLRASCSSLQTINVWMYNWRRSRWESVRGTPRTFEWGNFRLMFNPSQNPRDFLSASRARVRFIVGQPTRMTTDLMRMTISTY